LKVPRLQLLSLSEYAVLQRRFSLEAALLRQVDHPNIVRMIQELPEGILLLEWLPGRQLRPSCQLSNLRVLVDDTDGVGDSKGWWTRERVIDLGCRLASAFCHLQERFKIFVHNDLSPRNVLIDQNMADAGDVQWVKLIDFGLSVSADFRSVSSVVDTASVRIWEPYRAPEFAEDVRDDPRSDMYSLGVILYQMLFRQLPYPAGAARTDNWTSHPRLVLPAGERDSRFVQLVCKLLERDRHRRPKSWSEVEATLKSHTR
jgi:serine/threonine protein kinase